MTSRDNNFVDRLAALLVACAIWLLPQHRSDWGNAMRAEFESIDGRGAAFHWALGCVLASYSERLRIMHSSNLRISNWLLGLEAIVCFGPLTMLWAVALLKLNWFIEKPDIIVGTLLATMAPIGLVLALRHVIQHRLPNRVMTLGLAVGFLILGIFQVIAVNKNAIYATGTWFQFDWGLVILFSILPGLCCLHLATLTNPRRASV